MRDKIFGIVLIAILIAFVGLGIKLNIKETIEITVTGKERIRNGDKEKYLIYTKNEVFENTDSWSRFKFNSHDFQSALLIDSTYTVGVIGLRWPFMGWTRNIVEIQ